MANGHATARTDCHMSCAVLQHSYCYQAQGTAGLLRAPTDASRLHVALAPRIRRILSDLDAALLPGDMDIPSYRLHPLTGDRRDQWSVRVSGNWRIVFRFMDGVATDVNLIDYH